MILAPQFQGDDMGLARIQHQVYGEALNVIVRRCNQFTRLAISMLGEDGRHPGWARDEQVDHRTLQFAHDLLAAAWRYDVSPPQQRMSLSDHRKPEHEPDTPERRWLQWLDWEVASWLQPEAGPWDDGPMMIRSVGLILANQKQPSGDDAGSELARLIYRLFNRVPWDHPLYPPD